MGARTEEAEAVNRESWVAKVARVGARWVREQTTRKLSDQSILSAIKDEASQRVSSANRRFGWEDDAEKDEGALWHYAFTHWFGFTWMRCGLPRVSIGEKLTASLCSTSIPSECAPEAIPPWPSFVVDVPGDLLSYEEESNGLTFPAIHVVVIDRSVFSDIRCWEFYGVYDREIQIIRALSGYVQTLADLAQDVEITLSQRSRNNRADGAMLRFALGTILELNMYRQARTGASGIAPPRTNRRGEPLFSMVRLTRDVKVDCRQAVRDYIRGTSDRKLSVQTLVRGHWKMQPHGAGSSERKFIHVEPYWRGPEDAPIALKNHVLEGAK